MLKKIITITCICLFASSIAFAKVVELDDIDIEGEIQNYSEKITKISHELNKNHADSEKYFERGKLRVKLINLYEQKMFYEFGMKDKSLLPLRERREKHQYEILNDKIYKAALKDFDNAIKLTPENPKLYFERGKLNKKYKDSIADFDKAIALSPDNAFFYFEMANRHFEEAKYSEALLDYDKAIELNSNQALFYEYRGHTKKNLKDSDGAVSDYEKSIKLYQKDKNIMVSYHRCNKLSYECKNLKEQSKRLAEPDKKNENKK